MTYIHHLRTYFPSSSPSSFYHRFRYASMVGHNQKKWTWTYCDLVICFFQGPKLTLKFSRVKSRISGRLKTPHHRRFPGRRSHLAWPWRTKRLLRDLLSAAPHLDYPRGVRHSTIKKTISKTSDRALQNRFNKSFVNHLCCVKVISKPTRYVSTLIKLVFISVL